MTSVAVQHKVKKRRKQTPFVDRLGAFFRYLALTLWCSTTLFPFVWTIMSAFKDNAQIYGHTLSLPNPIILKNFPDAWRGTSIVTTGTNSLIYSFVTIVLVLILATPAAFYCAKITRNKLLATYFTAGIMIPVHAILIPCFILIRNMGLQNTRAGIILVYVAGSLPFSIFILTGFLKSAIPNEIVEASVIDGCNSFTAFLNIIPLCKTGIATAVTFTFLGCWNELLFALLVVPGTQYGTLNVACINLRGQFVSDQGLLSAGIVLLITPAIIIYTLFQDAVVRGLTSGAVKG